MPRKKSDAPAYRYHITGQARVTLDGKDFFLGEYDSPQSKARYYALLSEYNANGKKAPLVNAVQLANAPLTVRCIRSASDMFELCRPGGIVGNATRWRPFGHGPAMHASRLKFAVACFEDIGRVEALHLIATQVSKAKITLADLQSKCKEWSTQNATREFTGVLVYAFPQTTI